MIFFFFFFSPPPDCIDQLCTSIMFSLLNKYLSTPLPILKELEKAIALTSGFQIFLAKNELYKLQKLFATHQINF